MMRVPFNFHKDQNFNIIILQIKKPELKGAEYLTWG